MRILHVIPTMSPHDGGPTTAIASITRALVAAGADVTAATTSSRAVGEAQDEVRTRFPKGVPVHIFPAWPGIKPRGFAPRMAEWLIRHVREFDLVHLHSMFNWHSLAVPRIAQLRRVPYILRPLGTLDEWSRSQKSWKKTPYYHTVERPNLRHAAAIHVTSEAEAASVRALGFGEKAHCVPLGVELPFLRERAPVDGGPLQILFLSRIHPKKNLPILFQALAQTSAFRLPPRLFVAGDGDPNYVRAMHELAARLRIQERVEFVGYADKAMKTRLYAQSDLFALPSFQENFGIAVAEAMAHGLPAIVSTEVALATEVRESGAGAVASHTNAKDLAATLARFEDRAVLRDAGVRARTLVENRFSTAAMARALLDMYRAVVREG